MGNSEAALWVYNYWDKQNPSKESDDLDSSTGLEASRTGHMSELERKEYHQAIMDLAKSCFVKCVKNPGDSPYLSRSERQCIENSALSFLETSSLVIQKSLK